MELLYVDWVYAAKYTRKSAEKWASESACVTGEVMVSTQHGHALHASITED